MKLFNYSVCHRTNGWSIKLIPFSFYFECGDTELPPPVILTNLQLYLSCPRETSIAYCPKVLARTSPWRQGSWHAYMQSCVKPTNLFWFLTSAHPEHRNPPHWLQIEYSQRDAKIFTQICLEWGGGGGGAGYSWVSLGNRLITSSMTSNKGLSFHCRSLKITWVMKWLLQFKGSSIKARNKVGKDLHKHNVIPERRVRATCTNCKNNNIWRGEKIDEIKDHRCILPKVVQILAAIVSNHSNFWSYLIISDDEGHQHNFVDTRWFYTVCFPCGLYEKAVNCRTVEHCFHLVAVRYKTT